MKPGTHLKSMFSPNYGAESMGVAPVLSIIIPVYNERAHLAEFVDFIYRSDCPIDREFIFIDDLSSDGSREMLRELQLVRNFTLIEQETHQGKGAAVRRGIQIAHGDYILIQDADFELDPNDVPLLLEPLLEGRADCVYGSRFKKTNQQVHRTLRYFVNRSLTFVSNLFSGIYLTDVAVCYKITKADLLKSMNLRTSRFGFDVEFTAYIAKTAARIFELPIRYYPRTKYEGKKIGWTDGMAAFCHILRFNFLVPLDKAFNNLPSKYLRSPLRNPSNASHNAETSEPKHKTA